MIPRPDRIVALATNQPRVVRRLAADAPNFSSEEACYDPACVIENTCPITMISAVLGGPVLEPTRQEIELGPVAPLPPEVMTIHELVTVGTHGQSISVDTLIEPSPPPDPTDAPDGLRLYLQVAGSRA
jgi:hypothetical protein